MTVELDGHPVIPYFVFKIPGYTNEHASRYVALALLDDGKISQIEELVQSEDHTSMPNFTRRVMRQHKELTDLSLFAYFDPSTIRKMFPDHDINSNGLEMFSPSEQDTFYDGLCSEVEQWIAYRAKLPKPVQPDRLVA